MVSGVRFQVSGTKAFRCQEKPLQAILLIALIGFLAAVWSYWNFVFLTLCHFRMTLTPET